MQPETIDPIPQVYATGQWQPVAYLLDEGGEWIPSPLGITQVPSNAPVIRYQNGWIWDRFMRDAGVKPWRLYESE